MRDVAELVAKLSGALGDPLLPQHPINPNLNPNPTNPNPDPDPDPNPNAGAKVQFISNPRQEDAENELDVSNEKFKLLGLDPILLDSAEVAQHPPSP